MGNIEKNELIEAVLQYGLDELEYASKELLGDREFILELVKAYDGNYHEVLEYASEEIQADERFILELADAKNNLNTVEETPQDIEDIEDSEDWKREDDYSYFEELEQEKIEDELYEMAGSEDWKKVLEIVKRFNIKLRDKETILELVKQGVGAQVLEYIDENLKNDRDFIIKLANYDIGILKDGDNFLLEDEDDIIQLIYKIGEEALVVIEPEKKESIDFWRNIVREDPRLLRYAIMCEDINDDDDFWMVVFEALRQHDDDTMLLPEVQKLEQEGDDSFFRALYMLEREELYKERVPESIQRLEGIYDPFTGIIHDKEAMLKMISFDSDDDEICHSVGDITLGDEMEFASGELLSDKDFLLKAIAINYRTLNYADTELKKDKEFIVEVVKINACALRYVSPELQKDRDVILAAIQNEEFEDFLLWYADKEFLLKVIEIDEGAIEHAREELQNDPEILEAIEKQRKQKEQAKQYTPQEIAEGIEPIESAIQQVQEQMIAEETKEISKQPNDTEQK